MGFVKIYGPVSVSVLAKKAKKPDWTGLPSTTPPGHLTKADNGNKHGDTQQPTTQKANAGPQRLTAANDGQRRPTKTRWKYADNGKQ